MLTVNYQLLVLTLPRNTKILLSIMLIFGFAIVLRAGLWVQKHVYGVKANSIEQERQLRDQCKDTDQDGLCDLDEDFFGTDIYNKDSDSDGYLDGEEVAAGCDPLRVGVDNKCPNGPQKKENLTKKTADMLVAGIASGDLRDTKSAKFKEGIGAITLATLTDSAGALSKPVINESELNIIDDSDGAAAGYLNNLSSLIGLALYQSATEPISTLQDLKDPSQGSKIYQGVFLGYSNSFHTLYLKLKLLPVPKSWVDIHKEVLSNIKKMADVYLAISENNNDPIRAMSALASLKTISSNAQNILSEITQKSVNLSVKPNDQLFSVIQSLNSSARGF